VFTCTSPLLVPPLPASSRNLFSRVNRAQNGQSRGSGTLTCGSARLYWICSSDAQQSLSVEWPTIIMLACDVFASCALSRLLLPHSDNPRAQLQPAHFLSDYLEHLTFIACCFVCIQSLKLFDCCWQARGVPRSFLLLHRVPLGHKVRAAAAPPV
jgi:hypothetical protein